MIESLARVFATHGVVIPQTRWSVPPVVPKVPDNPQDGGSGFAPEAYRLQLSAASLPAAATAPQPQTQDAAANPPAAEAIASHADDDDGDGDTENGNYGTVAANAPAKAYGNPPAANGSRLNLIA